MPHGMIAGPPVGYGLQAYVLCMSVQLGGVAWDCQLVGEKNKV